MKNEIEKKYNKVTKLDIPSTQFTFGIQFVDTSRCNKLLHFVLKFQISIGFSLKNVSILANENTLHPT